MNRLKKLLLFSIFIEWALQGSCCKYPTIDTYLDKTILTALPVCESQSKHILLNNTIDSIVTHSSMELMTELPFTFLYSRSGKQFELVGECMSALQDTIFCILESACCGGNTTSYRWIKYTQPLDTIESICEVMFYTTTDIHDLNIKWHSHPRLRNLTKIQLRSTPDFNDTKEDEELRQIGNIIYIAADTISIYELGYNTQDPNWRLYAAQYVNNRFMLGWYKK